MYIYIYYIYGNIPVVQIWDRYIYIYIYLFNNILYVQEEYRKRRILRMSLTHFEYDQIFWSFYASQKFEPIKLKGHNLQFQWKNVGKMGHEPDFFTFNQRTKGCCLVNTRIQIQQMISRLPVDASICLSDPSKKTVQVSLHIGHASPRCKERSASLKQILEMKATTRKEMMPTLPTTSNKIY